MIFLPKGVVRKKNGKKKKVLTFHDYCRPIINKQLLLFFVAKNEHLNSVEPHRENNFILRH